MQLDALAHLAADQRAVAQRARTVVCDTPAAWAISWIDVKADSKIS
jgi:hypothetical protein